MKNVIFTIVAKNYIGLAMVLERSVRATTNNVDFYIFVADEFTAAEREKYPLPPNVLMAKEVSGISSSTWKEMAFKYNLVEFCTAIKPYCFDYLLSQQNSEKVIYLDPDIYVFNSLDTVFNELDHCSMFVTPHIVTMQVPYKNDHPDYLFLVNGIFNLGFLGVRKTQVTANMIAWWKDRLHHQCFFDNDRGMATDQKWMNMLPCYCSAGELHISRNIGLNVAPWNYFERKLVVEGSEMYIMNRADGADMQKHLLTFVHFSGYNYKSLANKVVAHKNENFVSYADLQPIFEQYGEALKDNVLENFISLRYTYNYFNNGRNIISINRRIFRRSLEEEGNIYDDPFATGSGSFYSKLQKCRLVDNSPVSADSVNNKNIAGFNKKIKLVNFVFRTVQRIIGIKRYSIMARFFKRYFTEENQYFLYNKESHKKFY